MFTLTHNIATMIFLQPSDPEHSSTGCCRVNLRGAKKLLVLAPDISTLIQKVI